MITTVHKSQPVDRAAIERKRRLMQRAIVVYACYVPGMTFTLDEIVEAFGWKRDAAWTAIQRLISKGYIKVLAETRDRRIQYQLAVDGK